MYFLYHSLDAFRQSVKEMINSLNVAWRLVAQKLTNHGKSDFDHVGDALYLHKYLRTFGCERGVPYPSFYGQYST